MKYLQKMICKNQTGNKIKWGYSCIQLEHVDGKIVGYYLFSKEKYYYHRTGIKFCNL
jgi:hypothetical protein